MFDKILEVVKEVALDTVNGNSQIPSDKKDLVVDTAASAITNGLTSNLGGLTSLLTGQGNSNSLVSGLQESVISSLVKKVGLDSGIAGGLVSALLPAVISALTSKVSSGGLNLDSLMSALGGESSSKQSSGLGGILGAFGKLFG